MSPMTDSFILWNPEDDAPYLWRFVAGRLVEYRPATKEEAARAGGVAPRA